MARAGRRKSLLFRTLVLGLVAMDLGVQLLSLPTADAAGRTLSPATAAGMPAEGRLAEGTLSTLMECLFRCFSDSSGAKADDEPVGDVEPAAFPRVEVMARHKAVPLASPLPLPQSPAARTRISDRDGPHAIPSSQVVGRSVRLCRLTC